MRAFVKMIASVTLLILFGLSIPDCSAEMVEQTSETDAGPKLILLSKAKTPNERREILAASKLESVKDTKEDGYLPVRQAIDCFDAYGYDYTGGRYNHETIRFRLRCPPKIKPGVQYPLIVWFHGKGESGDDNERQLAHLQYTLPFLVGPHSLDFFMLVTQCPKDNPYWDTSISNEGKGDAPVTIAMEIFEHLLDEFPIDRSRITTFGQCSGAAGSWILVKNYPDLVAAVVSICATPPYHFEAKDVVLSAFNCTLDPGVPIQPMRDFVAKLNAAGGKAAITEIESASHDAWTPALAKYNAIAWMVKQQKGSTWAPPPGTVLHPRRPWEVFVYFLLPLCCIVLLARTRKKKTT